MPRFIDISGTTPIAAAAQARTAIGGAAKIPTSVMEYGAVGDGVADDTEAIQAAIDDQPMGVYIPPGIYNISDTIVVPTGTPTPFGLDVAVGARIVATAAMDYMVNIGGVDLGDVDRQEPLYLRGGQWDANGLADCAIYLSGQTSTHFVSDVFIENAPTYGIYLQDPTPWYSKKSHDSVFSNIRINTVNKGAPQWTNDLITTTEYGIFAEAGDWHITGYYATRCETGIYSGGALLISDCHMFNRLTELEQSTGIQIIGDLLASNLYLDTLTTGITQRKLDDSYAGASLNITNLWFYRYEGTEYAVTALDVREDTELRVANAFYSAANDGYVGRMITSHQTDGTVSPDLIFNRTVNMNTGPDLTDCAALGSSDVTQSIKLINSDTHASGDGVLIGYIPPPTSNFSFRRQIIRLTNFGTVPTQEFDLVFAFSAGVPTSIMNARVEPTLVTSALAVTRRRGFYNNSGKILYFGIKDDPQTVDGLTYYPLYLYNTDEAFGGTGDIFAEIVGCRNGINLLKNQTWESGLTEGDFLLSTRPATLPSTTTFTPQAAAGVGATAIISFGDNDKTDSGGQIRITTGTSSSAGNMVWVAFGSPYADLPVVVVSPGSPAAASMQVYVTGRTVNGFYVAFGASPADSTEYQVGYQVSGTGNTAIC